MNTKRQWIELSFLVSAISIGGCAARSADAAADQIHTLEREVARLKSERANLDARAGALDDKVILLETRLKKCTQSPETSLQVVKLTPADMATEVIENTEDDETDTNESWEISDSPRSRGQKRPSLVLTQSSGSRGMSATRATSATPARSAGPLAVPDRFEALGADSVSVRRKTCTRPSKPCATKTRPSGEEAMAMGWYKLPGPSPILPNSSTNS